MHSFSTFEWWGKGHFGVVAINGTNIQHNCSQR